VREIRIHGRGGQGSVTAFEDGKYSQAFPSFGVERRGAPVTAFVRIGDRPIQLRSQIYKPDYVIVQDPTLISVVDVASGIKPDGMVLVNTEKNAKSLNLDTKANIRTVDATKVALEVLGRPIVNTTLLGAFAGTTGLISMKSIEKAVRERFTGEIGEKNVRAAQKAFEITGSEK